MFVAGVGPSMGSATARIAAREGAKVAVVGDTPSVLEETADSIRAAGGTATAIQCNLANDDDLRAAVETTVAQLGPIDAAFYNAAVYDHAHTSLEIDEALWQRTMDVNLRGPMTLARLTIPSMLERGGGAFVFNSSMASYVVHQYRPGYSVSKAGVNALTYFIAGRYGRKGIRANAIMPFVVGGKVGDFAGSINCIGRSGTAEEIGEAVVFLCSDRASLITGQVIHLDGGLLVRAPWPQVDDEGRPPPEL